jgi:surface protein
MDSWITAFKTGADSNAGLLAAATATIDGESGFIEDNYGSIEHWDTSDVQNMTRLFSDATHFNEDIRSWDTSNVETMDYMFFAARSFNWNIRRWNISSVTTIHYMFRFASDFNQNPSYAPPSGQVSESGWQIQSANYVLQ